MAFSPSLFFLKTEPLTPPYEYFVSFSSANLSIHNLEFGLVVFFFFFKFLLNDYRKIASPEISANEVNFLKINPRDIPMDKLYGNSFPL